jgi:hypothetical protein
LVEVVTVGEVPASPYLIKPDDTITFHIYDLTDDPSWQAGPEKLDVVVIEFFKAREGDQPGPFGDAVVLAPTFTIEQLKKQSAYFAKEYPYYSCGQEWQVSANAEGSHCHMMVTVIVTKEKSGEGKETRKFVVDPEMVIDSQGGVDPQS